MTQLLLVRHGETVDNVNKIMQGQTPGCLTLHGIEQAETLARRLAATHIDAFLSSDLRRAADTCAIIARPHNATPVQTPLLRERDWGSFTGRYIPSLKDIPWPDDIETQDAMALRASKFISFVRERWPGQTVLAVGHGIINKAIQSVLLGKPMNQIERMDNAEARTLIL